VTFFLLIVASITDWSDIIQFNTPLSQYLERGLCDKLHIIYGVSYLTRHARAVRKN